MWRKVSLNIEKCFIEYGKMLHEIWRKALLDTEKSIIVYGKML